MEFFLGKNMKKSRGESHFWAFLSLVVTFSLGYWMINWALGPNVSKIFCAFVGMAFGAGICISFSNCLNAGWFDPLYRTYMKHKHLWIYRKALRKEKRFIREQANKLTSSSYRNTLPSFENPHKRNGPRRRGSDTRRS